MRILSQHELNTVSGGAFDFMKSLNDAFNWLTGPANPFNGANIGNALGQFMGGFVFKIIKDLVTPNLSKK
ncbi:hypothetical protein [Enterobacter mori]|uniref:hypothetical protein n=1 Tax=Enterobacter mori TaxID=539813 RepID=UPI001B8B264B|nr:hypothetical protein [Enterobacter mori]MBS3046380.1 hypothetical protein [Enterobacter mori]